LDRALENGDHDEDRRPEHRDLPVLVLRELMRGDREVEVGDQPRDPDADREQARASPIAPGLIRRPYAPDPRHDGGPRYAGCSPTVGPVALTRALELSEQPRVYNFWLTDQSISSGPARRQDGLLLA